MPTVSGNKGSRQNGQHTREQIEKTHKPDMARDDIDQAFAGEENNGPYGNPKIDHDGSTNVKSRVTETSKLREHKH